MIKLPQHKADFLRPFTEAAEQPRLALVHVSDYNGNFYAATTDGRNLHAAKLDTLLAPVGTYALAGQWLHKIEDEDAKLIPWTNIRHLAADTKRYETEALTDVTHKDHDYTVFTSGHILPKESIDRLVEYGLSYKAFAYDKAVAPILFKFQNDDIALIMPADMVGYGKPDHCNVQEESEEDEE